MYFEADDLQKVVNQLFELATIKRNLVKDKEKDFNLIEDARNIEQLATDIRDKKNWRDKLPDENEQLKMIQEFMNDIIAKETNWHWGGDSLKDKIEHYFNDIKGQKADAIKKLVSFVEDQKNKILALKYIVLKALQSATHRSKDARLRIVLETMTDLINELYAIDSERLYYDYCDRDRVSWDYRNVLADNFKKGQIIEGLQEELKKWKDWGDKIKEKSDAEISNDTENS